MVSRVRKAVDSSPSRARMRTCAAGACGGCGATSGPTAAGAGTTDGVAALPAAGGAAAEGMAMVGGAVGLAAMGPAACAATAPGALVLVGGDPAAGEIWVVEVGWMRGRDIRCSGSVCSEMAAMVAMAHTANIFRRSRSFSPSTNQIR